MIPPVEVPPIRSKHPATDLPSNHCFSNPARNAAGKMPRMPPPSIDKMRNSCPSGQGRRTRRRRSVPEDRAIGMWPILPPSSACWLRTVFSTATSPCSRSQPSLITGQPVNRPGDDRRCDRHAWIPLGSVRIKEAEKWQFRFVLVYVVMGNGLVRLLFPTTQQWLEYSHPRSVRRRPGTLSSNAVTNLDRVNLAERLKRTTPVDEPTGAAHDLKCRPLPDHQLHVTVDGPHLRNSYPPFP